MSVVTKKVQGRRSVKYASLQEVAADAERMSRGNVKSVGNWSAGQIFLHLARSMDSSIDGFDLRFPLFVRVLAPLLKKKFLAGPMAAGYKVPAGSGQTLMPAPTSTDDGLAALRAAIARQEREPSRAKSPLFGNLTRDEWTQLHLIHSALHMSFLVPHS